jgi:hypothetical protein
MRTLSPDERGRSGKAASSINCITRRTVVLGLSALLESCSVSDFDIVEQGRFGNSGFDSRYGEVVDGGYKIPAVDLTAKADMPKW